MPAQPPRIGQVVKAAHAIILRNNANVSVLSSAGPVTLPKGTEAEIIDVQPTYIDLNCKDGPHSVDWGLKIRVAKTVWGDSFD